MLDAIGFDNYRIFDKETILNLKPITILTGPNSSGKSSVFKAGKLMKQNSQSISFGFPVDLSFIPDQYGHFLGEMKSIINSDNNKENEHKDSVSFIYPLNLPALGDNCFGKVTYLINKKIETKGVLHEYSIIVKRGKYYHKLIKLIADGEIFIKDSYHKIFIDYTLITKIFVQRFLPLLKKVEAEISNSENSQSNDNLINLMKNLPHYGHRDEHFHGKQRKQYITSLSSYLNDDIKHKEWLSFDKKKPILPYYKIVTGELSAEDLDQEQCENIERDYNEIWKEFKKIQKKEVFHVYEKLGFHSGTPLNKSQLNSIYSYFRNFDHEVFDFINRENIWFPFIHDAKPVNSLVQWNTITALNPFYSKDLKNLTDQLGKFDSLGNYVKLLDYLYHFSNKEEYINQEIIKNFIESLVLDSERQMNEAIKAPFFFDSNRIEQTLFYHSTNSLYGYNLLNEFYNPDLDIYIEDSEYIKNHY